MFCAKAEIEFTKIIQLRTFKHSAVHVHRADFFQFNVWCCLAYRYVQEDSEDSTRAAHLKWKNILISFSLWCSVEHQKTALQHCRERLRTASFRIFYTPLWDTNKQPTPFKANIDNNISKLKLNQMKKFTMNLPLPHCCIDLLSVDSIEEVVSQLNDVDKVVIRMLTRRVDMEWLSQRRHF